MEMYFFLLHRRLLWTGLGRPDLGHLVLHLLPGVGVLELLGCLQAALGSSRKEWARWTRNQKRKRRGFALGEGIRGHC